MIRRVVLLSAVVLFAILAHPVWGEETSPKQPMPPAAPTSSNSDADLAARVNALDKQVAALERQIADLKESRKELINIVSNHSTMLRDVVSNRESPNGGKYYVPNVQAIRADTDSRRELVDTVVHDMTRNSGELRIHNEMGTGQSLLINGVDTYYVSPHSSRTVAVASGTATTELAGEGIKSWMIGAPNYFQDIVIAPAVHTVSTANWQYDPSTGVWWRTLP